MSTRIRESGVALISGLIIVVVLVGASVTYLSLSYGGFESSSREVQGMRARMAAEEGLNLAMAELREDVDADSDGLGTITRQLNGRTVSVVATAVSLGATELDPDLYNLHALGATPQGTIGIDALVEVAPLDPVFFPFEAAITAQGPVDTSGNINIDGRDHDWTGANVVGPGVSGISTTSNINNRGSSSVGGNGFPPTSPPAPGAQEENADWADGLDNDGDGAIDEEPFNGLDDDGDGAIDEDLSSFPDSPDVLFGLEEGTLKDAAIFMGTYFTSQADLEAYVTANGGNIPGGKIIYADFNLWEPVQLGGSLNDPPSILIQHGPAGNYEMKNIHGAFRGLVVADFVTHINGTFLLVGGMISFADDAVGNTYGNGDAEILYSSEVLSRLPSAERVRDMYVHSWHRSVSQ